ncbi:hypothetical protein [Vibrio cholerae]|uniref:hypothetical protein n=1 Tax=Vibrio cholerae TaxID=666 RepID=UPI003F754CDA
MAFLLCVGFCGYGVMRKLGNGVGCPLTGRYVQVQFLRIINITKENIMQGLKDLDRLADNVKVGIIAKYGSLNDLYKTLMNLNHQERLAFIAKDENKKIEIQNEVNNIENYIESLGVEDATDITVSISNDYGDIVAKERIDNLNVYLAQFGTDFEAMRDALQKKYQ